MEAYKQVLDFSQRCGFCGESMVLLTNDDLLSPAFHVCMCQSPFLYVIQDGVGAIPSFAQPVCDNCGEPLVDGACAPCFAPKEEDFNDENIFDSAARNIELIISLMDIVGVEDCEELVRVVSELKRQSVQCPDCGSEGNNHAEGCSYRPANNH